MMKVPHTSDKWRKSSESGPDTDCVELHPSGAIRDSKNPTGGQLRVSLGSLLKVLQADQITR